MTVWVPITGDGNVMGPASSTDNAVARWDGTAATGLNNSVVIIGDTGNVSGIANLNVTGTTTLATSLTGPLKSASGVVSASAVNLTSEVTAVLPVANGGTNSAAALSNNRVMVSAAGAIVEASAITASRVLVSNGSGIPVAAAMTTTQLPTVPYWTKYTVAYTDLATAALTNDIALFSLPAKSQIHNVVLKTTTAFAGTTTYTISIGIVGTLEKYLAAVDVKTAVSHTNFAASAAALQIKPENFGAATSIRIAAVATVEDLDEATAGVVEIYVLTSLLP